MSEIIKNYQEEQSLEQPQPEAARLATVSYVGSSGLLLVFDGEQASDGKYYLCNNGIKYQSGDRVLVQKVGGSYIVVCRVGRPDALIIVDRAELARRAIRVDNMSGNYGDIEFAQDSLGEIWAHNVANNENQWVQLTGSQGRPNNINRPSWP